MNVLKAEEGRGGFFSRLDGIHGSGGRRDGRKAGHAVRKGHCPDFARIASFIGSGGYVKNHSHLSFFDVLKDVSLFLEDLADSVHPESVTAQVLGCSFGGHHLEPQPLEFLDDRDYLVLFKHFNAFGCHNLGSAQRLL